MVCTFVHEQLTRSCPRPNDTCAKQGVESIPDAEKSTLHELYSTTAGASWATNTGWMSESNDPCAEWFGVECVSDHVTGLTLDYNGLSGAIPTEVGAMTRLLEFRAGNNSLGGSSIPTQVGYLTETFRLDIFTNDIASELPSQIGLMTELEQLDCSTNNIGGRIPSELFALTGVTALQLQANKLYGSLQNDLLGALTQLQYLFVASNKFTGTICSEIGRLNGLLALAAFGNEFNGTIPSEVGLLTALSLGLEVSSNALSGSIVTEIGALDNLEIFLNFGSNSLVRRARPAAPRDPRHERRTLTATTPEFRCNALAAVASCAYVRA